MAENFPYSAALVPNLSVRRNGDGGIHVEVIDDSPGNLKKFGNLCIGICTINTGICNSPDRYAGSANIADTPKNIGQIQEQALCKRFLKLVLEKSI